MSGDHRLSMRFGGIFPSGIPRPRYLFVIGAIELRILGMVAPDRFAPGIVRCEESEQKLGCIGGVLRRIECRIQIGKSVGVMAQINLHAADVDIPNAACLQSANMFDGFGLGRKKPPIRATCDRPGLGKNCLTAIIPASGFRLCDRREEVFGNFAVQLCRADGRGTNSVRFHSVGRM